MFSCILKGNKELVFIGRVDESGVKVELTGFYQHLIKVTIQCCV